MRHAVAPEARPADIDLRPLTGGIGVYIDTLGSDAGDAADPPLPPLAELRDAGVPLNDEQDMHAGFRKESRRRRKLLALVLHDGHEWPGG